MNTSKESVMTSRPLLQELFAAGLYKPKQGRMVRQVTALTIWLVAAVAAWRFHSLYLSPELGANNRALSYLLAVGLAGVGCWFGFRLVNWPKFADFLISVEAELNKVSWPTQKELIRASMVVIFTILFLSAILFAYDAIWRFLFTQLGVA